MTSLVEISQARFHYGETQVLNGVDFSLQQGELVALIGPSGCGKTTLFRIISGLLEPAQGSVTVGGRTDTHRRKMISFMMQEDMLLPWRTVMDNVLLATELAGDGTDRSKAQELLDEVGLGPLAEALPGELSGGMRQRVALARALLHNRPVLLLDEPFHALDVARREDLFRLVRDVHTRHNKTTMFITHDFRDALSLADRVLLLSGGKITHDWTIPAEVRRCPELLGVWQQRLRSEMGAALALPSDSTKFSLPLLV